MQIKKIPSKIKRLAFLARKKGLKYAYNYVHLHILFGTKNPFLIKMLYWLSSYPPYLEIEVTTKCNLKCIMCERTYWSEPSRDMSFEEFKGILDQFPKLKWIGLTGIGESFLNKDFLKMLRYVKSRNIYVELYDPFFFIDKETAKELIDMGIDKLFISLDAARKETYEKIRVGSNFDLVTENLKNFFKLKKEMKAHFPEIAFHFIVNKLNMAEIPQYLDLVRSVTGGENEDVQITRMLHSFKETEDLFTEIPEELAEKTNKKAEEMNIDLSWSADVPLTKPPIRKCTEWIMPFIFVTGHVVPCCAGNEAGQREFQKETALGNVFEQNFKEIWQGPKYKSLRKILYRNKVPLACKNCCLYETNKPS